MVRNTKFKLASLRIGRIFSVNEIEAGGLPAVIALTIIVTVIVVAAI